MYMLFFINSTSTRFSYKKPLYKKLSIIPSKTAKPGYKLKVERETNESHRNQLPIRMCYQDKAPILRHLIGRVAYSKRNTKPLLLLYGRRW